MTGGQMAPTTLEKQPVTTTAPFGRYTDYYGQTLDALEMLETIAQDGAYLARVAVDNPIQLKMTLEKALKHQAAGKGFSFVEALSYCPTNWKTNAKETINWLQKFKKEFPLYEKVIGSEQKK